jgi:hypothetical protein
MAIVPKKQPFTVSKFNEKGGFSSPQLYALKYSGWMRHGGEFPCD